MVKYIVFVALPLLLISQPLYAQKLLGNVGVGVGYDAFLHDQRELPYHNKWPFAPGIQSMFGVKYLPENGFAVFLNATAGIVNIQIPAPGYGKSSNYFKQFHTHITIGSGPEFHTERSGTLVPYLHLGAGFYSDWGEVANNSDQHIIVQKVNATVSDTWALICGAGLDWQMGLRRLSSLNLQISYTPMDIYDATPQYRVYTPAGAYDIKLQGRLLQLMLTYNTHFTIKKWHRS